MTPPDTSLIDSIASVVTIVGSVLTGAVTVAFAITTWSEIQLALVLSSAAIGLTLLVIALLLLDNDFIELE